MGQGGAAGKLQAILETWVQESSELVQNVQEKAKDFDLAQDTIDDKTIDRDKLAKTIDRKTNLGPVRAQNNNARERLKSLQTQKSSYEYRLSQAKKNKVEKEKQLDEVAMNDKQNETAQLVGDLQKIAKYIRDMDLENTVTRAEAAISNMNNMEKR